MLFQNCMMTDGNVTRYFPAGQCLWPVLNEEKVRKLAEKNHISHHELGCLIRRMLKPVHYTCVPDRDMLCQPPKYTTYDPAIGHHHIDKLIKAKDLSKADLQEMDEAEQEHKHFLRSKPESQPFGWWDMQAHTYQY